MDFVLTEEQTLLQDQVAGLLSEHASAEVLRELITDRAPWKPDLWNAMSQLGLTAAAIPEAYGGVELGLAELCVINRELGRAVAPVPYFSSICMAAEAIRLTGNDADQARWLPGLASGEQVATFAWAEGSGAPPGASMRTRIESDKLYGAKSPVPDVAVAGCAVVAAMHNGRPALAVVELDQPGVRARPLEGFDQLRAHSALEFDGAPCTLLANSQEPGCLADLFDRFAVMCAFEQAGGIESALYMARDYTMERFVFGRQLASYQAVKHNLANILASLEMVVPNAIHAASAIERGLDDRASAAATARIGATEAYERAARENLQLHGGIGFTWEANCHFHYRRARLLALNLGSVDVWTDRLIDALAA